ncbi:MAG: hypothetical protein FWC49_07070 [Proteobacteria bacterium]|nr:hypothetical protein [Pseudomonadota bacterium]
MIAQQTLWVAVAAGNGDAENDAAGRAEQRQGRLILFLPGQTIHAKLCASIHAIATAGLAVGNTARINIFDVDIVSLSIHHTV